GIGHMHTRAALIGARLRIGQAGRKSGGTRVVVELDRQPSRELAAAATMPGEFAVSEAT
ncbi:MAG: ATPase, partial [Mesorhizobium sp.]